jgi:hypothetical protein
MQNRGVIYCAINQIAYLEAALISALTLRQFHPELPISIVCDHPLATLLPLWEYGIKVIPVVFDQHHDTFRSRDLKTCLANISPYNETLYLDADILPLQPLTPIWEYLAQGDMAMTLDRQPTIAQCDHIDSAEKTYTMRLLPEHTPQYNSGVMLWRNCAATQKLFKQWQHEWQKFQQHDQLALARAISTAQTPIVPLPTGYNISPIDAASCQSQQSVYLLHCWGGQVLEGGYRQIANRFYPTTVTTVQKLLFVLTNQNQKKFYMLAR